MGPARRSPTTHCRSVAIVLGRTACDCPYQLSSPSYLPRLPSRRRLPLVAVPIIRAISGHITLHFGGQSWACSKSSAIRHQRQRGRYGRGHHHRRGLRQVVTSLVNDVIMPPIGMLLGGVNFSSFPIALQTKKRRRQPCIKYGVSQQRYRFSDRGLLHLPGGQAVNRLTRTPPAEPTTKICPQCLSTIPLKAVRCAYCTSPVEN